MRPIKEVIPINKFKFDDIIKFSIKSKSHKLSHLIALFPNYGIGFKIQNVDNKIEFTIDNVNFYGNKSADIYGKYDWSKNYLIERLKDLDKWKIISIKADAYLNNNYYKIEKIEEKILIKEQLLNERDVAIQL